MRPWRWILARIDSAAPSVKERQTRQLEATYAVVCAAHDHPTAEQVHARVRRKLRNVSLGTIYRNLQKLAAQGRIQLVQLGPRGTRFDGMLTQHEHFVCDDCGKIIDLPASSVAVAVSHAAPLERAGYGVTRQSIAFFGACPPCREAAGTRKR